METNDLGQAKTEAFAQRMVVALNEAALALMMSIGHRTHLFDTMAGLPPATGAQIAAAANLNARYVREWLGAMVTGRIIEYNPVEATFYLPPEHAASLTRAAAADNVAIFMQYIAMLGAVEDGIVECFHHGGGMPYSAYPRFQEIMAEESRLMAETDLVTEILPLVPGLVDALQRGIQVLDVGCGCGHVVNVMAQTFPQSQFTGYDFSAAGIAAAQAEAADSGLTNVHFAVQDVAALNEPGQYELITAFDVVHDQAQPARLLAAVAAALRPESTFLMQDIRAASDLHRNLDHPLGPMYYTISCMHCMTVSLAQDGVGLGTMWGEELAQEMLAEAGFKDIAVKRLPSQPQSNYYIATKSRR